MLRSSDANKCADVLQKLIEIRRTRGSQHQVRRMHVSAYNTHWMSQLQLIEALCLLLPDSAVYPVLSNLPPVDPTNPTSSVISSIQAAVHDSLAVLQEVVALVENQEADDIKRGIETRRTRLNAGTPEEIRKAVEVESLGASPVDFVLSTYPCGANICC